MTESLAANERPVTAIDLRTCLTAIQESLESDPDILGWSPGQQLCWEGCWLGGLAPTIAALAKIHHVPVVIVTGLPADLDTLARDLDYALGYASQVFPQGYDETEIDSLLHQESLQRLQVCSALQNYSEPPVVATTLPALMQSVPSPEQMAQSGLRVYVGQKIEIDEVRQWLRSNGYLTTTSVQMAGEFTVRGGLLDVFPPDLPQPIRIEWFDNEIESIRSFDTISQRSLEMLEKIEVLAAGQSRESDGSLLDYLPPNALVLVHEPAVAIHHAETFLNQVAFPGRFESPKTLVSRLLGFRYGALTQVADSGHLGELKAWPIRSVERIGGQLDSLATELSRAIGSNREAFLLCLNQGELDRADELFSGLKGWKTGRIHSAIGTLASGFEIVDGPFVLTLSQMLRRTQVRRGSRKIPARAIDSFLDLKNGDLIVHLSHGIGVYRGLEVIERQGKRQEHLVLEYAEGTKIYVPTTKIDLVQRYVGGTKQKPRLAKIGSQTWVRQKNAAKKAVTDMASDLLELQAQRKTQVGISFANDSAWQQQFETAFPFTETPDQLSAISAIRTDMIAKQSMDRLICGDVGFGKTEVAMRAAFRAVDHGYQVALLAPTTVLAEQHYKTFRERMAEFPIDIERLSRFCDAKQEREILGRLKSGNVDIVIGTHRLASKDIRFHNLGMVIIDEEQKFGVAIKERLKQLAAKVDVLTLSATPIPRTLHMSLVGVRDISNLETAPEERLAVETKVIRFCEKTIRNAILREIQRGGQVYFVHNRVQDIEELARKIAEIVPECSIVVGHGQMPDEQLEQVMMDFVDRKFDVLLATTIIESGLDIPNANTMIIDEAHRYGLSTLHQLRGRVGRYKHQAYCYLLIPKHKFLTPDSARRLHAIEEYSQIGAGFGIAMRDLEIRGAGNLLGTQQSGHIATVGYELYCQLLESAVRQLKKAGPKFSIDVDVNLNVEAYLPSDYVPDMRHKIDLYRRLSRIEAVDQIEGMRQELIDRFGPIPQSVENLVRMAELRIDATIWLIRSIFVEDDCLMLAYADRSRIEQLCRRRNQVKVLDGKLAFVKDVDWGGDLIEQLQSLLCLSG